MKHFKAAAQMWDCIQISFGFMAHSLCAEKMAIIKFTFVQKAFFPTQTLAVNIHLQSS